MHRSKHSVLVCITIILIAVLGFGGVFRVSAKTLILAVAEGVRLTDLAGSGSGLLKSALDNGAVGLLNSTTARSRDRKDSYASIAMGARAVGGSAAECLQRTPGGELRYTGVELIRRSNQGKKRYGAAPGILVDILSDYGIKTALFTASVKNGEAGMIAMDSSGRIEYGTAGTDHKFGELVQEAVSWTMSGGDRFTVVELGGLSREESVKRLILLLTRFSRSGGITDDNALIFVSPKLSDADIKDNRTLVPMAVFGSLPSGVLTSASTRRAGVAANIDVAPTVLTFFGLSKTSEIIGLPVQSVLPSSLRDNTPVGWLVRQELNWTSRTKLRTIMTTAFVAFLIICFFYIIILIVLNNKGILKSIPDSARVAPAIVMWWPLAFMVTGFWAPNSLRAYIGVFLLAMIPGIALTAILKERPKRYVTAVCSVIAAVIVVDQLTGGSLAGRSIMSYDLQTGARFYGLGNEYMGVLIGSSLVALSGLAGQQGFKTPETVLLMSIIGLTIGLPIIGANVGGLITAILGYGVYLGIIKENKPGPRFIGGLLVLALIAVGLVAFIDKFLITSSATHLTRSIVKIGHAGIIEALRVAVRKFSMNLSLIAYTPWNSVYLSVLLVLTYASIKPVVIWQRAADHYPWLMKGFQAAVIASIAALLFNDSGIVASALLIMYPFYALSYLYLSKEKVKF